jgi:hypothetical protein
MGFNPNMGTSTDALIRLSFLMGAFLIAKDAFFPKKEKKPKEEAPNDTSVSRDIPENNL